MRTARRIDLRGDPDTDLMPVLAHLEKGRLLAYPTETIYGLGGSVTSEAVRKVQTLKARDGSKPLLVLVDGPEAVAALAWSEAARTLARAFWPGALTLVLKDSNHIFPVGIRSERTDGVGVRVSPHPFVRRLLAAYGRPITSTSLNVPGTRPARTGREALEVAGELGPDEILVLDGGTLPPSLPSTVVDCTGPVPIVLREGSIPTGRLRCAIPEIHERPDH